MRNDKSFWEINAQIQRDANRTIVNLCEIFVDVLDHPEDYDNKLRLALSNKIKKVINILTQESERKYDIKRI